MKSAVIVAAVVAVAAYAAGAWSAAPPTPTERKLQAGLKLVQTQLKKDQADIATLKKDQSDTVTALGLTLLFSACNTALTADALQGTFQVIDQLSVATQAGKTYFGPQTPVDDTLAGQPACQLLGITRSQVLPPTAGNLAALLLLLHGP